VKKVKDNNKSNKLIKIMIQKMIIQMKDQFIKIIQIQDLLLKIVILIQILKQELNNRIIIQIQDLILLLTLVKGLSFSIKIKKL